MTLCPNCRSDYQNTNEYYIQRIDPTQIIKESCTYCSVKFGYDYEIIPKPKRKMQNRWVINIFFK